MDNEIQFEVLKLSDFSKINFLFNRVYQFGEKY
jgi:hypothetical protein